jgi:hypothetical protein
MSSNIERALWRLYQKALQRAKEAKATGGSREERPVAKGVSDCGHHSK